MAHMNQSDDSTETAQAEAPVSDSRFTRKHGIRISTIQGIVSGAVFAAVAIGLAGHTGTGTLSSFGYDSIASVCPLGALEVFLGTWMLVPRALIGLAGVVVLALVFGRAFCSWICPVPHLNSLLKSKKRKDQEADERSRAADYALTNWKQEVRVQRRKIVFDTRYAVLAGALVTTALFGFPVFCTVCPIGLSFATFIAFWRFVQFNDPTWGLLVFPAIVVVELLVLGKWCKTICPLGALLSLISTCNRTFRPHADKRECLRSKGLNCQACDVACPESIDPVDDRGLCSVNECIRCGRCSQACPAQCITFPPLAKDNDSKQ